LKQSKEKPLKRMKTRSNTKINKDSEPPTYGIMNLALASLSSQNSNTNESDDDCDNEI